MNRDVGKLGEKTLDLWATQANIIINKAFEDEEGWDYILEFPLENFVQAGSTFSLDKRPYPLKCFIQVKSSDNRPGTWAVKLDNWERLVKNPLPVFFLVCEFDAKDDCQRAYLVHIDEFYIRLVLKKLREFSVAGVQATHKHRLIFSYEDKHLLSALSGHELARAVKGHIHSGLEVYSSNKMELVKTVGYESEGHEFTLMLEVPKKYASDPLELLIDFFLGLVPQLDPKKVEIRDTRFGIEAPQLTQRLESGRVEIQDLRPVARGLIIFSLNRPIRELQIEADVYVPQGIGFDLDHRHRKVRFSAPFINFVTTIELTKGNLHFELPLIDEQYLLSQLQPVSALILLIDEAIQNNAVIEHEVILESKQILKAPLPLTSEVIKLSGYVSKYAQAINYAWTIAKHFDIQHRVEVKISELCTQLLWLEFVANALLSKSGSIKVEYYLDKTNLVSGKYTCMPLISSIVLGQYKIVVGLAVLGIPRVIGSSDELPEQIKHELKTNDIRLHATKVLQREEVSEKYAKHLFSEIVNNYESSAEILITEGFNDHLSNQ